MSLSTDDICGLWKNMKKNSRQKFPETPDSNSSLLSLYDQSQNQHFIWKERKRCRLKVRNYWLGRRNKCVKYHFKIVSIRLIVCLSNPKRKLMENLKKVCSFLSNWFLSIVRSITPSTKFVPEVSIPLDKVKGKGVQSAKIY